MYVQDCMPMMADVISGQCPLPVELPDGADVSWIIPGEEIPWIDVAPAWRKLELGDVADYCLVACQGREPREGWGCPSQAVRATVAELRELLGELGAAICGNDKVLVFNADGTRVAIQQRPEYITLAEASARYGVPPSTLRRYAASGEIVAKKRGKTWWAETGSLERKCIPTLEGTIMAE